MHMAGPQHIYYRAEPEGERLIEPLDAMTLIYQRRSGITHIVADPVPQILAAMGGDAVDAALVAARLATRFDLGDAGDARAIITARLEELAALGLVEKVSIAGA
jgi:PqqD family protein of HPr-rel-A system